MKNIILIHGIGGFKRESYFSWLKTECEKIGLRVFIPQMPGWKENATYKQWYDIFERECASVIGAETIILAQSLGTQFAIKYLCEKNREVAAYISCAGPRKMVLKNTPENEIRAKDFDSIFPHFHLTDAEFAEFKKFKFPKFSLYSNNDNFFEQSNLEDYANAIGAKHIFVPNKMHFNIPAGIYELPEALEVIAQLCKKP